MKNNYPQKKEIDEYCGRSIGDTPKGMVFLCWMGKQKPAENNDQPACTARIPDFADFFNNFLENSPYTDGYNICTHENRTDSWEVKTKIYDFAEHTGKRNQEARRETPAEVF